MKLPSPVLRATAAAAALTVAVGAAVATAGVAGAVDRSSVWSKNVVYGSTDHTIDGDTEAIRVDGDPSTLAPPHIRNSGIQAMEVGQCHAAQAAASMDQLTRGKRVRLSTTDVAQQSQGRPARYVDVLSGSSWVDVQLAQLQRGHALPLPGLGDISRWRTYAVAAQQAARARTNLFDTDFCRSGPSQLTPLRLWINYDGNGDDATNPNSEWVKVLNLSTTTLPVGGWWMRTAAQDNYVLPSYAVIPARGVLTIRVGKGTNTATQLFLGSTVSKFKNTDLSRNIYGGAAYLFDRDGDIRAWSMYPCLVSCVDSKANKLAIWVRADAPGVETSNVNGEYVRFTPRPGVPSVDMSRTVLVSNGFTYEFPGSTLLMAGETLTLYAGKGTRTRLNHYWGNSTPVLVNSGQRVELRTPTTIRLGCRAWGTFTC